MSQSPYWEDPPNQLEPTKPEESLRASRPGVMSGDLHDRDSLVHGSSHVIVENAVIRRPLLISQVSERGKGRELTATCHRERARFPVDRASSKGLQWPGTLMVETMGIEPTTPCLQSRPIKSH